MSYTTLYPFNLEAPHSRSSMKVPHVADFKSAYISHSPAGLAYEIMGWESSDAFRFDRGPLLQGQTRIAKLKSGSSPRGNQNNYNPKMGLYR